MSAIDRLPLSARLALRQLRSEKAASVLTTVALAFPATGAIVALIAIQVDTGQTSAQVNGTVADDVPSFGGSVGFLLSIAPIVTLIAVIVAAVVAAATLVRSRSQDHTLALLEMSGSTSTIRFRIASARGILLGLVASVVAALIGTLGGLAYSALFLSDRVFHGFPTLAVVVTALASVPVAWVASIFPLSIGTGRPALAVLRGTPLPLARRWERSKSGRMLVVIGFACGLVALVTGLLGTALQPTGLVSAIVVIGLSFSLPAVALVIIGASLQAPTAFSAVERLLERSTAARSTEIRLAVRDAATSPVRTVPIVATIMLICFVFTAFTTFSRSSAETVVVDYPWSLQLNQASVQLIDQSWSETTGVADPAPIDNIDEIKGIFESSLGVDSRILQAVKGPYYGSPVDDFEGYSGRQEIVFPPDGLPVPVVAIDGPCSNGAPPTGATEAQCAAPGPAEFSLGDLDRDIWVGDLDDLAMILGHAPDAATRAAFSSGDALLLDARLLDASSRLTLNWYGPDQFVAEDEPAEFSPTGTPLRTESVRAAVIPLDHKLFFSVFLSPATAVELGIVAEPSLLLAQLDRAPSDTEQREADAAIFRASDGVAFPTFELGPSRPDPAWVIGALLIAFGGCIAIALTALPRQNRRIPGIHSRRDPRQRTRTACAAGLPVPR